MVIGVFPSARAQDLVRSPNGDIASAAPEVERVVVVGRADDIIGVATSSSEGYSSPFLSTHPLRLLIQRVKTR